MLDFVNPIDAGGRLRSFNRLRRDNECGRKALDSLGGESSGGGAGSRCEDRFAIPRSIG
jgi:hypothetical protein